jgi:hypothetical protein
MSREEWDRVDRTRLTVLSAPRGEAIDQHRALDAPITENETAREIFHTTAARSYLGERQRMERASHRVEVQTMPAVDRSAGRAA